MKGYRRFTLIDFSNASTLIMQSTSIQVTVKYGETSILHCPSNKKMPREFFREHEFLKRLLCHHWYCLLLKAFILILGNNKWQIKSKQYISKCILFFSYSVFLVLFYLILYGRKMLLAVLLQKVFQSCFIVCHVLCR